MVVSSAGAVAVTAARVASGSMSSSTGDERDVVLAEGRFLRLIRRGRWEFVQRTNNSGVVGIIATTDDGRLVLVEQWRPPVGKRCIELPAGLVGDEDPAEEAAVSAARELEEETGYRARSMQYLTEGVSSAGLTGETLMLFRAKGLEKVHEGGGTEGEKIQVHAVPLEEVPAFVRRRISEGLAVDMKVWTALWFAAVDRSPAVEGHV